MHLETCRSCGGELDRQGNYYVCRFCGNKWMIDAAEDVHVVDRANAWAALRDCDFEKAAELFENIIFKDKSSHEAHWGRALALAGIIYVTDFHENRRVPTCNNISESSFLESRDVKAAIELAPADIADSYRAQAEKIDMIRAEWVKKARKEPPYDVFICFKDSDRERGLERTDDSYEAQNLYHALKEEGYKVFFSRESLRGKVSEHYEPYIYNALRTAKVMIVYGQNPEYFSAVWVKNEWLRFRNMIESGDKPENSLVVAYKGIDPADLPTGLRSRQCMNAAEFTFFDDLKAHIRSVIKETERSPEPERPKAASQQPKEAPSQPKATPEPVKAAERSATAASDVERGKRAKTIALIAAIVAVAIIFGIAAPSLFINEKEPEAPKPVETYAPGTEVPETTTPETTVTEPILPPETEELTDAPEEPSSPTFDVTEGGIRFWLNDDNQSYKVVSAQGIEDLVIPDTCNDLPVTAIMEGAFLENSTLVSATIPESVVIIEKRAFYGCTALSSVVLGSQVTEIGEEAFMNCSLLADLTIPENSSLITVGSAAFNGCLALKSVMLPDSVESIGDAAFHECKSLEEVSLGNKITEIAPHLFQGCEALTEINIPESVNKIGDYAFDSCKALMSLSLPDGVTSIGEYALSWCSALTALELGKGIKSIGRYALEACTALTSLTLPEGLETIDEAVFWACDSLKSITVPKSVTSLGAHAFSSSKGLESVTILGSITEIRDNTFFSCEALTSVTLPDTVTKVGKNAFGYTSLSSVTFMGSWDQWDSIEIMTGNDPLKQAKVTCLATGDQLDKLRFEENENGGYTVYNNGAKGNIVIPDTYNGKPVTAIGENGFRCFSVTSSGVRIPTYVNSITIPASVVTIGKYAFGGCADLETLIFKEGSKLQSIGVEAFKGCSSLVTLTLPDSVESIGYDAFYGCDSMSYNVYDNASYLGNEENPYMVLVKATSTNISSCEIHSDTVIVMGYAFRNCDEITEIVIPAGVKKIHNYAFYECAKINKITIPYADYNFKNWFGSTEYSALKEIVITGGESIVGSAFKDCKNIKTVTIPASVKTIGKHAFENCISLESVNLSEGLITIDESAFSGCTNLWNIAFPTSLETIGKSAFSKCSSLGMLVFAANGESNLKTIGFQAFSECTGLTSVTIPDSLESMGDDAFWKCAAIEEMTLPFTGASLDGTDSLYFEHIFGGVGDVPHSLHTVTLTKATDFRFTSCSYIKNITIPDNVTEFVDSAFSGCKNLEKLNIPSGLKTIGSQAFYGCAKLGNIELPDTLESIGGNAFSGCGSFTEITVPDGVTYIGSSVFTDCDNLASLTVPFIGETRDAENGKRISMLDHFFFDNYSTATNGGVPSSLKTVVITDALHICDSAFDNCGAIESITVNGEVADIGQYAFRGCSSLKSLVLSDSIESIGDHAFDGCTAIESLTLPESLKTLGSYVFKDCTGLGSVTIRDSVTRLGFYMFSGCTNLKTVNYTGTEEDWAAIGGLSDAEIPVGCEIIYNYVPTKE